MARLLEINPELRVSNLDELLTLQRAEESERWTDGLQQGRLSGMKTSIRFAADQFPKLSLLVSVRERAIRHWGIKKVA